APLEARLRGRSLRRSARRGIFSSACGYHSKKPMPIRFLFAVSLALTCGRMPAADGEAGRILRPADNSWHQVGPVDLVATAESGKLQLDGAPIQAEQPFPNVFHTTLKVSPGLHSVVLTWEGSRKEVRFFVGANPPAGFQAFHQ